MDNSNSLYCYRFHRLNDEFYGPLTSHRYFRNEQPTSINSFWTPHCMPVELLQPQGKRTLELRGIDLNHRLPPDFDLVYDMDYYIVLKNQKEFVFAHYLLKSKDLTYGKSFLLELPSFNCLEEINIGNISILSLDQFQERKESFEEIVQLALAKYFHSENEYFVNRVDAFLLYGWFGSSNHLSVQDIPRFSPWAASFISERIEELNIPEDSPKFENYQKVLNLVRSWSSE